MAHSQYATCIEACNAQCAEACRRCAEECRRMAQKMPGKDARSGSGMRAGH